MTAQEWLDELLRLNNEAILGPWEAWQYNEFLGKGVQGIVTRISTRPLDPDDEIIKVADSLDITASDAAYIVAACNAVPRLVEMVKLAASLLECPYDDEKCYYDDDDTVSCAHCKAQRLYDLTEPKE